MAGIFLSYRRSDSGEQTRRLHERLALRYGEGLVWRDEDDIPLGSRYLEEIRKAIRAADAVLVVIGPRWLAKRQGRSRLREPGDVLRREIEWALASRADVAAVLVGGAGMPARRALPKSIAGFAGRESHELREESWDADSTALIEGLRVTWGRRRRAEPLRNLHEKLYRLQERIFGDLDEGRWDHLLNLSQAAQRLLDDQAPHYPQDALLQNFRGYTHKNRAIALRGLGREREALQELGRAGQIFGTLREETEIRTAEAYNGLGSVEALNGHYGEALTWIDRALALVPDYPAALEDRERVLAQMRPGAASRSARRPATRKPTRAPVQRRS